MSPPYEKVRGTRPTCPPPNCALAEVDSSRSLHFKLEPESIFKVRAGAGVNINVCAGANRKFFETDVISVMMFVVVKQSGINFRRVF